jgi:lipoprotein-releasing system ATP-binding protein
MGLLVAEHVTKRYARGSRSVLALHDVSLTLSPGELVTIRGLEPNGRKALTLVLAGLASPDDGTVRFDGRDVFNDRRDLVPSQIAVCWERFPSSGGVTLLEQVAVPLLLNGATRAEANTRARDLLARVGAENVRGSHPHDVEPSMLVRAAIARAIALRPQLVLANDLSTSVDLIERDAAAALLHSLTRDEGVGVVLMGTQAVPGADRALEIRGGTLLGATQPTTRDPAGTDATVLPFHRASR